MTPRYYEMRCGDLYEHFRTQYPYESCRDHLLMEAQQYLHRCLLKGQYLSDLEKVGTIIKRLILWHKEIEEENA